MRRSPHSRPWRHSLRRYRDGRDLPPPAARATPGPQLSCQTSPVIAPYWLYQLTTRLSFFIDNEGKRRSRDSTVHEDLLGASRRSKAQSAAGERAEIYEHRILQAAGLPARLRSDVAASAASVSEKIVTALAEPIMIEANRIHSGASVGIAVHAVDSLDAEMMLAHADVALYRAKAEQRGTYRFFSDGMDAEVRARVRVSAELRDAITANQFYLMYQPQVDMNAGRILGLEALIRWRHPTLGTMGPDRFIGGGEGRSDRAAGTLDCARGLSPIQGMARFRPRATVDCGQSVRGSVQAIARTREGNCRVRGGVRDAAGTLRI